MKRTIYFYAMWPTIWLGAVMAAACSGGSGGGGSGTAPATGPAIAALAPQSVNQDTTIGPLPLTVTETGGDANLLVVTAASSNPALVPDGNIVLAGGGAARTLALTPLPDAFGATQVSITATDAQGHAAHSTFMVNVNPVYASFTRITDDVFATLDDGQPVTLSGITLQPDADDNVDAFTALLQ
jgi:hypothetical protein